MQRTPASSDALQLNISNNTAVGGSSKRAFDVGCALLGIALVSLALLLLAIIIKATSKGPILFRQPRIGYNAREFECLKFRTMTADADHVLKELIDTDPAARAEWIATQKLRRDPRVTSVGRFLRATSLDELPQLWNVLVGDMSLVGPRPIVRDELPRYGAAIRYYYNTRPGLTGAWQISGRNDLSYQSRVAMDKEYAESWSFSTDLWIMLKTIPAVVLHRGAY